MKQCWVAFTMLLSCWVLQNCDIGYKIYYKCRCKFYYWCYHSIMNCSRTESRAHLSQCPSYPMGTKSYYPVACVVCGMSDSSLQMMTLVRKDQPPPSPSSHKHISKQAKGTGLSCSIVHCGRLHTVVEALSDCFSIEYGSCSIRWSSVPQPPPAL